MKTKIKALCLLVCAACMLVLIPVFLSKDNPIEISMPVMTEQQAAAQEQAHQKAAQASAKKAKVRRILRCETDDDCIIVDKDPCGCLVGPEGVTAINASYTLEFNKMQSGVLAKACPDSAPSQEKGCSPSAVAVCRENICEIDY